MIFWIYDIPNWSLGILVVAIFTTLPTAFLFPMRHWVRKYFNLNDETNNVVGMYFSGACVFYGLLLGLVAVSTWQNFSDAASTVSKEASQIAAVYRDVSSYPEPHRNEMQEILRQHVRFIIEEAWPAHRKGTINPKGETIMVKLQDKLLSFEPATAGQQAMHAETLRAFNEMLKLRRLRMDAVFSGLPIVFWAVALIGTSLTIAITYLFHIGDIKSHILLTAVTGFLVGLLIFLIAALDHPFRGEVSIAPDSYRLVLENAMSQ